MALADFFLVLPTTLLTLTAGLISRKLSISGFDFKAKFIFTSCADSGNPLGADSFFSLAKSFQKSTLLPEPLAPFIALSFSDIFPISFIK
ncbi:hypothetical protein HY838_02015 [Candidatus Azambacteria bacterium]|nr:hypothetical protein [Candidatus Azambacteria bacterium]